MDKNVNPKLKIAAGSVVCSEQTQILGDVRIGSKTIVHPTAKIIAENGPIVIGQCNLIEELVTIINKSPETMTIGSYNVFEVGSHCEAPKVGDNNVLEYRSSVGPNTTITNGCVIGSTCSINTHEVLAPNTVIHGTECKRSTQMMEPTPQTFQLDFLIKVLPNYQKIEKTNYKATDIPVPSATISPMSPTD